MPSSPLGVYKPLLIFSGRGSVQSPKSRHGLEIFVHTLRALCLFSPLSGALFS
jgi:hypothetical protein